MTESLISPLANLLKLERPLIVLDYETTGIDPATARICSIGMRRHNPNGTLQVYKTLVNPDILMPQSAADTHGITQETIDAGCAFCWHFAADHPTKTCEKFRTVHRFHTLAPRLLPAMTDVDFAGYNIFYDLRVAAEEFAREGMTFDYSSAAIIDGKRLWQLLEPRTLSDAVEYFAKRKLEGAHDAMIDVEGTEDAIIGQLTGHPRSSILPRNVRELHDLQWPPDPNRLDREGKFVYDASDGILRFTFGKWKGKPVGQHLGYVQWMTTASFAPEIRRLCERILAGEVPMKRPEK